jgi:hypothetical protein
LGNLWPKAVIATGPPHTRVLFRRGVRSALSPFTPLSVTACVLAPPSTAGGEPIRGLQATQLRSIDIVSAKSERKKRRPLKAAL